MFAGTGQADGLEAVFQSVNAGLHWANNVHDAFNISFMALPLAGRRRSKCVSR